MSGSGDYISRADAIEAMYKDAEAHPDHTFWTTQHEALLNIPAADVRPVVTCGECIHRHDPRRQMCTGRRPDFFCADGKKREES